MAQIKEIPVWTEAFRQISNSPELRESYKTQMKVMDELFPSQPKDEEPYSLPEWYMENRENDLILYYAFGFLHPTEREFLYHHMVRWANGIIQREKASADPSQISADGTLIVNVPRPTVSLFFKDWASENFVTHENLLMRLQPAMKLIERLDKTLHNEGVRCSSDEWVSAIDELMCQDIYPEDEEACWLWMNKMAAPKDKTLFSMDLSRTQKAMEELNWFKINRVMADCRDFAKKPIVKQRVNGTLKECLVPWVSAKIEANQKFLEDNDLISKKNVENLQKMPEAKKNEIELLLKQNAVAGFLEDLAQAAPSREWLMKMEQNFERYFSPILQKVGYPVMGFDTSELQDNKGNPQKWQIMYVTFSQKNTYPVSKRISNLSER